MTGASLANNALATQACQEGIRILVVADGKLKFRPGDSSLGMALDFLSRARVAHPSRMGYSITTAHRRADEPADLPGFSFSPGSLSCFDQLWLFGARGAEAYSLTDDEVAEVGAFLERGGGVFATGDHTPLGTALCGRLHKVRWMRRWIAGPGNGVLLGDGPGTRNPVRDTSWPPRLSRPGVAGPANAGSKLVWPRMGKINNSNDAYAHALFELPNGDCVRWLPYHDHEGECPDFESPVAMPEGSMADFPEGRIPVAVAWAMATAGKGTTYLSPKPVLFPVACVYDGHGLAPGSGDLGRIVTDSSFHHWLQLNLSALGASQLRHAKAYHCNVARWLVPEARRKELLWDSLACMLDDPDQADVWLNGDQGPANDIRVGEGIRRNWEERVGVQFAECMSVLAREAASAGAKGARIGVDEALGVVLRRIVAGASPL